MVPKKYKTLFQIIGRANVQVFGGEYYYLSASDNFVGRASARRTFQSQGFSKSSVAIFNVSSCYHYYVIKCSTSIEGSVLVNRFTLSQVSAKHNALGWESPMI